MTVRSGQLTESADETGDIEYNIQGCHRAPPQHHLRGRRGADGIDTGGDKTRQGKRKGFQRTGAG